MTKVKFKTTRRYLEINGKEYEIAERTGKLERRIAEDYEAVKSELSEYERYRTICRLLLGEDACEELFPLGEDENLDRMAQIAYYAEKEFNHDRQNLIDAQLAEIDGMTEKINGLNNAANGLIDVSQRIK